ncbi:NPCBM/NEW2 domain containing protein [Haloferula helveola]|uniref:NPCBM/NEW2 domain containing protein n=1 Tax=Haloferula helveola TaxID=490095 RepID=A0ABN6H3V2_9BACT|nr:NPCBM/NEW2 domain containing protein [Haloferula helveola]
MKLPGTLAFLAFAAPVFGAMTPQEEIDVKVPAAMALLEKWENESPQKGERKLHLVYWTPKDRKPQPMFRKRLTSILEDIRDFYASEMKRLGFGPRTINLDYAPDGLLNIHLVEGRKDYSAYNVQSGGEIRTECLPTLRTAGLDPDKETLVIFCNMSNWDPENRKITQNSPYYAGGSPAGGNAWQVDSAILELGGLAKTEPKVHDGQYGHISIGRYNTIFIGGICHELGHALGLPHNRQRDDEGKAFGTALMGSGNRTYGEDRRNEGRGSFLTLAHGLKLASHPMFSGSVKQLDNRSNAKVEGLRVEPLGKSFRVHGKVTADPAPYAVIGYMDPAGGGDYNATTCTAVPDAEGNFTLDANGLVPGEGQEFRIVVCQVNGACSTYVGSNGRWEIPYRVGQDGNVDLSAFQAGTELAKLIGVVNSGNRAAASAELESLRSREVSATLIETAESLVGTLGGASAEDPSTADGGELPLTSAKATHAEVGWSSPRMNRVPDASALIISGGELHPRGIYAHAPASHRWSLGGKWKSLDGKVGIGDGSSQGSCDFVIVGDGKEIWRSGVMKAGSTKPFAVGLEGIKELELKVTDGGDGKSSDWGLWLDPVLRR